VPPKTNKKPTNIKFRLFQEKEFISDELIVLIIIIIIIINYSFGNLSLVSSSTKQRPLTRSFIR
jgi:hypothetical protein